MVQVSDAYSGGFVLRVASRGLAIHTQARDRPLNPALVGGALATVVVIQGGVQTVI